MGCGGREAQQRPPSFFAPGTCFLEYNFSTGRGVRDTEWGIQSGAQRTQGNLDGDRRQSSGELRCRPRFGEPWRKV